MLSFTENGACLICSEIDALPSCVSSTKVTDGKNGIVEILTDVFEILALYMDWKLPSSEGDLAFKFMSDAFPFCKICRLPLMTLVRLHQQVQQRQQQIRAVTLWMSSKILESRKEPIRTRKSSSFQSNAVSEDPREIKIREYYRNFVFQRYQVQIKLSFGEQKAARRQLRIKSQSAATGTSNSKTKSTNLSIEENSVEEQPARSSPLMPLEGDPDDYQQRSSASSRSLCSNDNLDATFYVNEDEGDVPSPIVTQALQDEETISVSESNEPNSNTQNHSHISQIIDSEVIYVSSWFSGSGFRDRVKQIAENVFVFDSKRFFEYVSDTGVWRCHHWPHRSNDNIVFIGHFTRRARLLCSGNPLNNAVEEFRYANVIYDQLRSRDYECRVCPHRTSSHNNMKSHIKATHQLVTKKRNPIQKIDERTFTFNNVKMKILGEGRYQCGVCKVVLPKTILCNHIRKEHSSGKAKVKVVRNKQKFLVEGKVSFEFTDRKRYKCHECSHSCCAYRNMVNHVSTEHIRGRRHVCELCGKSFRFKQGLKKHQLTVHLEETGTVETSHVCHCGKVVGSEYLLRLHQRLSHGPFSYMCHTCGKAFATPYRLKYHMGSHDEATCHICDHVISARSLRYHMLSHSQIFKCEKCEKTFRYPNGLDTHSKSCGGAKPYECDVCGMKFTQSYNVVRHKNVVHNPDRQTGRHSLETTRKISSPARSRKKKILEDASA